MGLKKEFIKRYMLSFSTIGKIASTWEGYSMELRATTEEEKTKALLKISESRYEESKEFLLDAYFKTDLKTLLEGKDVLEVGSNHGGASLAYYELYNLNSIVGIDTTERAREISKKFFATRGLEKKSAFYTGFAEQLPFADQSFDAIISFDVFEHVQDVQQALKESWRVLRPGGMLLAVFPSYYHPTQHHLFDVTYAPFIHWFFKPEDLMDAYWEILDQYPTHRDNIGAMRRPLHQWEKLYIINGTTLLKFKQYLAKMPWSSARHVGLPMGEAGTVSRRPAVFKIFKYLVSWATKIPLLDEITNQRIVYILTK
jgi:ubiquinone/menaquinone biosynthesis C-methylase UbiE